MRVLNLGSLNLDYTFRVDAFIQPKETKLAKSLSVQCGGKGLNQSVALSRAGFEVLHGGLLGTDGGMLADCLAAHGVSTELLIPSDQRSGNAMIQVDDAGQNCILLYGGTNQLLTEENITDIFCRAGAVDLLVLQNEVNKMPFIIDEAHRRGIPVAFNAAPMNDAVRSYPLEKLSYLIVNEVEGAQLSGCAAEESDRILNVLSEKYPETTLLLTLGAGGAKCRRQGETVYVPARKVPVVDTTAAGDTFIGFFLHSLLSGESVRRSMDTATAASALCIGKHGAADSIPAKEEVAALLA